MSHGYAETFEKSSRSARAEASVWIVRLHSEGRTPELEAGLREWLAAHPENEHEFEHLTDVWEMGGAITADGLPRMKSWGSPTSYRQWAVGAAAVAMAALGLWVASQRWIDPSFATQHGEQRLVRLDDGSRISLNSDTRLSVEFSSDARRVRLQRGEGLFEVAKDPSRPFVVQVGERQITALGTTFVVRYDSKQMDVTLVEGKVSVAPLTSSPLAGEVRGEGSSLLSPGQRLIFTKSRPPKLDTPRIDAITAWRRGEVLLDATPLTNAVAEMNRYDHRQLVIDEPALAGVRVSGVYRTGDSPGFARAVAELHGLAVREEKERIHLGMR